MTTGEYLVTAGIETAGRWLRVSTSGQDEANQEPDIDGWISGHEYATGPTYQLHGKSASKGEQDKEIAKVIADMKAGVIQVLVVWHSSRIERRGAYNAFDLARKVREAGGRIEYVQDAYLNETNAMSDVMLALAASQNRQYSENISKQTIAGFDRIDGNGAIRNRAGYGHRIVGSKKYHKRFELDDAEADVIRMVVTRYLDKKSNQSLEHICRWLTSEGHHGRNGAAFTPKTLGKILRSTTVIGEFRQGDVVARVPAIITVRQHEDVLAKLDAKGYRAGVRTRPDSALLTSVLYCGTCGRAMYRLAARNDVYYYCRPRAGVPSCRMMIPMKEADSLVIEDFGLKLYLNERTQEVTIPGHDYADDIDHIVRDIKALDPTAPGWLARVTEMQAEIARLGQLDPEPPTVKAIAVDTVAEANRWAGMPIAEKRERLLDTGLALYAVRSAEGAVTITSERPATLAEA